MDLVVLPVAEQHAVSARTCIENGDPLGAEHHYRAIITLSSLLAYNDIRLEGPAFYRMRQYRIEAATYIMQREADAERSATFIVRAGIGHEHGCIKIYVDQAVNNALFTLGKAPYRVTIAKIES